jgi:dTDP-4-dehydrorhamnose reductase
MRIAIVGAAGQLGQALVEVLASETLVPLPHEQIELTDRESVFRAIEQAQPEIVINAAAYNFVDRAGEDPLAFAVNSLGPRYLAMACEERGCALMHVSTDYVFGAGFDAHRRVPYVETDVPGPLNKYGLGKLAGELYVRGKCSRHFIVRTCGLYGKTSERGKGNFVQTMLRVAGEGRALRVVDDQFCTPTSALDLARALSDLLRTEAYGLYHAVNAGETTWYGFACEIFRIAGLSPQIVPVTSAEYLTKARRPAYSVLSTAKLDALRGVPMRPWREALQEYLGSL